MKFKSIMLAFCLAVTGICFAAGETAPQASAATQTQQVQQPSGNNATTPSAKSDKPTPKKGQSAGQWFQMLLPIILVVVMIFIFSRSNKKQQQKRQQMLDGIVKGTRVMLNSGVYGKVYEVREHEFLVEIAENVRVLVTKNGVATVEEEEDNKSGESK